MFSGPAEHAILLYPYVRALAPLQSLILISVIRETPMLIMGSRLLHRKPLFTVFIFAVGLVSTPGLSHCGLNGVQEQHLS